MTGRDDRRVLVTGAPPAPVRTCRAPAVNLHFAISGIVQACCVNGRDILGDVRRDSLDEIWNGEARREMSAALARGEYPLGCGSCEVEHALGHRDSTPAPPFDHLPAGDWPNQLEFTLSNRCNLACVQCNGWTSSTIRAQREHLPPLPVAYGDAFFEQLVPYLDHVQVVSFLGGEPFLIPEAKRVWDLLRQRDLHPRVQTTTNATVWSAEIERYVRDLEMNLAISIDGATATTYEAVRVGARYAKVVDVRDRLIAAARTYGGDVQINWCLMPENWHEVGRFMLECDELDVDANVIPVFEPESHSLFVRPASEMAAIVAALAEEDLRIRDRLVRNRGPWDAVVGMLRAHSETLDADGGRRSRHVEISGRWDDRGERAAELAAADLVTWSGGRQPIVVTGSEGRVVQVDAPPWAESLHADDWLGSGLNDIEIALGTAFGPARQVTTMDPVEHGAVLQAEASMEHRAGTVQLRAVYIPARDRLLLAALGDLPTS